MQINISFISIFTSLQNTPALIKTYSMLNKFKNNFNVILMQMIYFCLTCYVLLIALKVLNTNKNVHHTTLTISKQNSIQDNKNK